MTRYRIKNTISPSGLLTYTVEEEVNSYMTDISGFPIYVWKSLSEYVDKAKATAALQHLNGY